MKAKVTSIHTRKTKTIDCPLCGNKSVSPHIPFCSRRCSQLDLGNWLNEAYSIPIYDSQDDTDVRDLMEEIEKDS